MTTDGTRMASASQTSSQKAPPTNVVANIRRAFRSTRKRAPARVAALKRTTWAHWNVVETFWLGRERAQRSSQRRLRQNVHVSMADSASKPGSERHVIVHRDTQEVFASGVPATRTPVYTDSVWRRAIRRAFRDHSCVSATSVGRANSATLTTARVPGLLRLRRQHQARRLHQQHRGFVAIRPTARRM